MNAELEINCKTVTGILSGASVIQPIQVAEHGLDHIKPRNWKRETEGIGVERKASDGEL
jgi:hypothetical protein